MSAARALRPDGALRRAVDLLVAVVGLVLLSPLLVAAAVAVKLDSRGPALFSQQRVGRGGRTFRILKFRSMVAAADRAGPSVSGRADPRITRVGRFLRDTKIDELPQLWNLLLGDVTLVGPRAEVPEMIPHYTDEERELLDMRPGLTGPGALYFTTDQSSSLGQAEDAEEHYVRHQLHPKLALDLDYARERSLSLDLRILRDTVAVVLGAFRPGRRGS